MGSCCGKDKAPSGGGENTSEPAEPAPTPAPDATPEPTPAPTPAAPGNEEFARSLLEAQNEYRAKHGVPPLTLSQKLCDDAQAWADTIAGKDKLEHSNDRDGAGENLAWSSAKLTGAETAKMWYDEIENYDFRDPGFRGNTGHFTQLVWKNSSEFGAAYKEASGGGTYVVGRYSPAGNITNPGQFEENVFPPK